MTGGLAAVDGARCVVADAGSPGRGSSRRAARLRVPAAPLAFPARVFYSKDEVFSLCDALARAEAVMIRAGQPEEAARVAAAFELLEGGLA
jgi:hypothetical protein